MVPHDAVNFMTPVVQLLRDLVALPSVNPALLPAGDPRAGEHRVADFLIATGAKAGLTVETQEVFPGRSNVFIRLTPTGKVKHRIVLAPHMDTVGGDNLDQLLEPEIRNGRLYGRGACDTKGCVAAMLTAVLDTARSAQRPQDTEIVFIGLIDEEVQQSGSRAVAASGFEADLAIVGEPTQLKVITAHKGDAWLWLETTGKAAHGARPELGDNAIHRMAKVVELLETKYAQGLKKRKHPLLGHGTVNVGTIQGGFQSNIVPAHCTISIDRRTLPGETETSVRRELTAFFKQHGVIVKLAKGKGVPCLALETDHEQPLVQALMELNRQTKPIGVDYFCDAAVLAQGGIPSIVFGPGDIAQAHTGDEWISLASLERGTALLTRFLKSLP
jgi:acetylornithine deacetylase/succinyl-diaminopimelate desuccinylase-like protein